MSRTLAPSSSTQVGRWGEDIALTILRCNSYSLLERNWRPYTEPGGEPLRGEIDLVMIDPEMNLVFVEVKTRSSDLFGHPLEAISRDKSKKLRALAYAWSRSHDTHDYSSMRIDAVSICGEPQRFTFEHLTGVA